MKSLALIHASKMCGYVWEGWSRLKERLFVQLQPLPFPCLALTPRTAETAERSLAAAGCKWAQDLLLTFSPAVDLKKVVFCSIRMTEAIPGVPETQMPSSSFFKYGARRTCWHFLWLLLHFINKRAINVLSESTHLWCYQAHQHLEFYLCIHKTIRVCRKYEIQHSSATAKNCSGLMFLQVLTGFF